MIFVERTVVAAFAAFALVALSGQASNRDWDDCDSKDNARIIRGCTNVLRAKETPRNRSIAFSQRGRAYYHLERHDEALADYNQAIALSPDASDYHDRALVYGVGKKQYDLALKDIDRAIAMHKDKRRSYYVRGGILRDMGDHQRALANYLTLLKLDPKSEDTGVHARLADTYVALGRPQEAIPNYKKCIEYDSDVEHCKAELKKLGVQ